MQRNFIIGSVLAGAPLVASVIARGPLVPPPGPVAETGYTVTQIYDAITALSNQCVAAHRLNTDVFTGEFGPGTNHPGDVFLGGSGRAVLRSVAVHVGACEVQPTASGEQGGLIDFGRVYAQPVYFTSDGFPRHVGTNSLRFDVEVQ